MSKRSNLDICVDILYVAKGGVNKTKIVYQANLNFKIVKKYLKRLIDGGLLEKTGKLFVTTQKGTRFIEQYRNLVSMHTNAGLMTKKPSTANAFMREKTGYTQH